MLKAFEEFNSDRMIHLLWGIFAIYLLYKFIVPALKEEFFSSKREKEIDLDDLINKNQIKLGAQAKQKSLSNEEINKLPSEIQHFLKDLKWGENPYERVIQETLNLGPSRSIKEASDFFQYVYLPLLIKKENKFEALDVQNTLITLTSLFYFVERMEAYFSGKELTLTEAEINDLYNETELIYGWIDFFFHFHVDLKAKTCEIFLNNDLLGSWKEFVANKENIFIEIVAKAINTKELYKKRHIFMSERRPLYPRGEATNLETSYRVLSANIYQSPESIEKYYQRLLYHKHPDRLGKELSGLTDKLARKNFNEIAKAYDNVIEHQKNKE